jgi:hypothetical protein
MTDERSDEFRAIRLVGGTDRASQGLTWAAGELVRRQQNPLDGDESRRERWSEALVVFVERFERLKDADTEIVRRLATQGRPQGIIVTIQNQGQAGGSVRFCQNEREPDGEPCPGFVRYAPYQPQGRCDVCGGWMGLYAPEDTGRYRLPPAQRVINLRTDPSYQPYFISLAEIKQIIDQQIQEMNDRSTRRGIK